MIRTLVLDSSFKPVAIVSGRRGFELSLNERVQVLDHYTDHRIRTVKTSFPIPAVLRVDYYNNRSRKFSPNRQNILLRDNYRCQYCGKQESPRELTLDHVLPRHQLGINSWTNLVTACAPCNLRKGSRTPEQANMPLLRKPTKPKDFFFGVNNPPEEWLPYL